MKAKVDVFRSQEFETVLDAVVGEYGNGISWHKDGLRNGELHYHFDIKPVGESNWICVDINSTIQRDGLSATSGENSIRAWLSDRDGAPLGNKIQRWVTRLPGWQERLSNMLFILLSMGQSIEYCEKCKSMEKVFIVKKEGKNKGRLFIKCNCPNSFTWLDETDQEEEPTAVKADVKKAPSCPKCGAKMILRHRKDGSGQFWGCSIYPACNGARDVDDTADEWKPVPVEPTAESKQLDVAVAKVMFDVLDERRFDAEIQRRDREDEKRKADDKQAMERQARLFPDWTSPVKSFDQAPMMISEKPKGFAASKYHLPIFDWVKDVKPGTAMVVGARAGSGKTTTGVEMFKMLDPKLDSICVVFNKHVVEPMKARAPKYVRVCTYNSLGFTACRAAFGNNLIVDEDKEEKILRTILDKMSNGYMYPTVLKLAALVKANLTGTSYEELNALAEYYSVEINGDADTIYAAVGLVIEKSMEMTTVVSYNDQCWLPIVLNLPCRKYDFVFIDEAQDTNKCQAALVLKSRKPSGRIVAVGDEFQSMYGFRGADAKAMENLINTLNAEVFPLSITYRNPKSVVRLVNERFPEIPLEAAEWAEEGIVRHVSDDRALLEYVAGDMVVCRTNAPLVKPVFTLIRRGVKATIRGRDIGKNLTVLVRKINALSLQDLIVKLTEYKNVETAKLLAAEKFSQAQNLGDKVDTIVALCDSIQTISELENRIENIFSDDVEGIVFSSIHRVKGLESNRVFILRPDLLPHPMAKKEWETVQERNIEYVAYTRAIKELVFVDGGV